jgi:hypothetical protein
MSSSTTLRVVATDVGCGPYPIPYPRKGTPCAQSRMPGSDNSFVIVDDYSRFTWVFFLHDKSVVQDTFKKFAKRAQTEFETKIKRVRSDNGT